MTSRSLLLSQHTYIFTNYLVHSSQVEIRLSRSRQTSEVLCDGWVRNASWHAVSYTLSDVQHGKPKKDGMRCTEKSEFKCNGVSFWEKISPPKCNREQDKTGQKFAHSSESFQAVLSTDIPRKDVTQVRLTCCRQLIHNEQIILPCKASCNGSHMLRKEKNHVFLEEEEARGERRLVQEWDWNISWEVLVDLEEGVPIRWLNVSDKKEILIREQQWPCTERNLISLGSLMCPTEMMDKDELPKLGLI